MQALSSGQIKVLLKAIPEWSLERQKRQPKISRSFQFANFVEAFGFMSQIALMAEKLNHHPDWSNVYNRVDIVLWTHDVNGLSEKDFLLAQTIDQIFQLSRNQ